MLYSTDDRIVTTTDTTIEGGLQITNVRLVPKADGTPSLATLSELSLASYLPADRPTRVWQNGRVLLSNLDLFEK